MRTRWQKIPLFRGLLEMNLSLMLYRIASSTFINEPTFLHAQFKGDLLPKLTMYYKNIIRIELGFISALSKKSEQKSMVIMVYFKAGSVYYRKYVGLH